MTQDETQHTLGQFDEIEDLIEEAKELEHLKEINQELLEAAEYVQPHLREFVEYHQKRGGCSIEMEQALELIEAAIAKARGQQ